MRALSTLVGVLLIASPAFADHTLDLDKPRDESDVRTTVEAGGLLPWTLAPRHPRKGLTINTYGGYDLTMHGPAMMGTIEGTFVERVTLRATSANYGMSTQLQPSFGVLVDVMREDDYGMDLAVGGDYDAAGWNRVPALVTCVAAGRTIGLTRVQANAAFGLGMQRGERYGDLRLAGLHPVGEGLYAGLDSRARVDLERDSDEPSGEPDWDVQAGPVATYAIGRVAVSANAGVSAYKLRNGDASRVGAIGSLGVGAVF